MKTKMPDWRSDKQVRAFWARHSSTEFEHLFQRVKATFPKPRKRLVSLRIEVDALDALRALAQRKGVGHLTLARMWITERLGRELSRSLAHPSSRR